MHFTHIKTALLATLLIATSQTTFSESRIDVDSRENKPVNNPAVQKISGFSRVTSAYNSGLIGIDGVMYSLPTRLKVKLAGSDIKLDLDQLVEGVMVSFYTSGSGGPPKTIREITLYAQ